MTEGKLENIVVKTINQWAKEEWLSNDNGISYNDRFNHNLETFIELLQERMK